MDEMGVFGIAMLAHFCELHGPSIVFCTQMMHPHSSALGQQEVAAAAAAPPASLTRSTTSISVPALKRAHSNMAPSFEAPNPFASAQQESAMRRFLAMRFERDDELLLTPDRRPDHDLDLEAEHEQHHHLLSPDSPLEFTPLGTHGFASHSINDSDVLEAVPPAPARSESFLARKLRPPSQAAAPASASAGKIADPPPSSSSRHSQHQHHQQPPSFMAFAYTTTAPSDDAAAAASSSSASSRHSSSSSSSSAKNCSSCSSIDEGTGFMSLDLSALPEHDTASCSRFDTPLQRLLRHASPTNDIASFRFFSSRDPCAVLYGACRRAVVRALSCEVCEGREGPLMWFDHGSDIHALLYTFKVADLEARGHQRFYSIMVLLYEESVLLTCYNTIVAHILQLVRQIQHRAAARLEREQTQRMRQAQQQQQGSRARAAGVSAAAGTATTPKAQDGLSMAYGRERAEMVSARYVGGGAFHQGARRQVGRPASRALPDLIDTPHLYRDLHVSFTTTLRAVATFLQEKMLVVSPNPVTRMPALLHTVLTSSRTAIPPSPPQPSTSSLSQHHHQHHHHHQQQQQPHQPSHQELQADPCQAPKQRETTTDSVTLPSLLQVLGPNNARWLLYHVLVGNQIVVQASSNALALSILQALERLLPPNCITNLGLQPAYLEGWHGNLIALPNDVTLPTHLEPNTVFCIGTSRVSLHVRTEATH